MVGEGEWKEEKKNLQNKLAHGKKSRGVTKTPGAWGQDLGSGPTKGKIWRRSTDWGGGGRCSKKGGK